MRTHFSIIAVVLLLPMAAMAQRGADTRTEPRETSREVMDEQRARDLEERAEQLSIQYKDALELSDKERKQLKEKIVVAELEMERYRQECQRIQEEMNRSFQEHLTRAESRLSEEQKARLEQLKKQKQFEVPTVSCASSSADAREEACCETVVKLQAELDAQQTREPSLSPATGKGATVPNATKPERRKKE